MLTSKLTSTRCAVRPATRARCLLHIRASAATDAPAQTWTRVLSKDALKTAGGQATVEVTGNHILLADVDGEVKAYSNMCPHLGFPLIGKSGLFQAQVKSNCITCPVHKTTFSLETGEVVGDWCPALPDFPIVHKVTPERPMDTFQVRVSQGGDMEVLV